jgi:hypothetical protein
MSSGAAAPNKCMKFARTAPPTRKGDAPLLAAYARRWAEGADKWN